MCFPVYQMLNGTLDGNYKMVAVYTDFAKLMDEWVTKFGDNFFWEPWPLNATWEDVGQ